MVIYGVTLLAICLLAGTFLGEVVGVLVGVDANVGGVGIAMLMLVLLVDYLKRKGKLKVKSQEGVAFWSAMYIPIVIAMAAKQNVVAAVDGGPVAILAGVTVVGVSWAMVPLLSKIGKDKSEDFDQEMIGGETNVRNAK
ncbi:malonate transporter subunit MadL [Thalassobacillus sp. CUG 92003]|uniref:malonate transporter subunit MadL n=1 Tax=Thalassobacillus sp. CUG 92003 TaxID=2736641 RepID=UPI0015E74788|nr:malonate transporter subunit MadL [Thalassobacillus sp. CUG 92003]